MRNHDDFSYLVTRLTELGLTKYESLVYLAVLNRNDSSAKEASQLTGIPYGKVYEVINNLVKKGFLYTLTTKPLRFNAVPYKEALANVKSRMNEKLAKVEEILSQELEDLSKEEIEEKTISIIEGNRNIYKKICDVYNSDSKISICGHVQILKKILSKLDTLTKKEKGKVRVILFKDDKTNQEEANALKKNAREILNCKIKIVNSDNRVCILTNNKDCLVIEEFKRSLYSSEPFRAVLFSNSSFSQFLITHFNMLYS